MIPPTVPGTGESRLPSKILDDDDIDRIMIALGYRVSAAGIMPSVKLWEPSHNPGGPTISVPRTCPASFLAQRLRRAGVNVPPDLLQ